MKNVFGDIDSIQDYASMLYESLNSIVSLYENNLSSHFEEIKASLVEYNKQRDELFNKILKFENINTAILNSAIELTLNKTNIKILKKKNAINNLFSIADKMKVDIELEPHDNNVLTISEKEQKAYLPFFYTDIKKIFKESNNKYKTMQDVVDDLYVLHLDNFKNSSISRFREAFLLMKYKEKSSITKALDLGLELMFRCELNPIIIAACRNLDELDIYLNCLDENEVYEYPCFKINFEVNPIFKKKK